VYSGTFLNRKSLCVYSCAVLNVRIDSHTDDILPKINVNGLSYLCAKWAILCRVLHTQIPPSHGQHEDLNGQSEDKSQLYNLSNP